MSHVDFLKRQISRQRKNLKKYKGNKSLTVRLKERISRLGDRLEVAEEKAEAHEVAPAQETEGGTTAETAAEKATREQAESDSQAKADADEKAAREQAEADAAQAKADEEAEQAAAAALSAYEVGDRVGEINADVAIDAIKEAEWYRVLQAMREDEDGREDGPRVTVIAAIDKAEESFEDE